MSGIVSSGSGEEETARTMHVDELSGWFPVDAITRDGHPYLKWMEVSHVALTEPLFHQSVERLSRQKPAPRELLTDLDALLQLEKVTDSLRPTGFIFHVSRCGSTLVTNACRALSGSLVLTEAQPVDKLAAQNLLTNRESNWGRMLLNRLFLRGAVSALGQRWTGNEKYYFIKFAFAGFLQYENIKSIWQDVPCVFIYRDPVEVMVSNLRNRPQWMRLEDNPEESIAACIGVTVDELRAIGAEEYCARSLGRLYAKAAELADSGLMLVRYEELSLRKLLEIIEFFGVTPTPSEIEAIQRISQLYSKDAVPARIFTRDSNEKKALALPLVREMATRWASESYQRLNEKHEELRRLGAAS